MNDRAKTRLLWTAVAVAYVALLLSVSLAAMALGRHDEAAYLSKDTADARAD